MKGPSRETTQQPRAHVKAHLRTSLLHNFDYSHNREQVKLLGLSSVILGNGAQTTSKDRAKGVTSIRMRFVPEELDTPGVRQAAGAGLFPVSPSYFSVCSGRCWPFS